MCQGNRDTWPGPHVFAALSSTAIPHFKLYDCELIKNWN